MMVLPKVGAARTAINVGMTAHEAVILGEHATHAAGSTLWSGDRRRRNCGCGSARAPGRRSLRKPGRDLTGSGVALPPPLSPGLPRSWPEHSALRPAQPSVTVVLGSPRLSLSSAQFQIHENGNNSCLTRE